MKMKTPHPNRFPIRTNKVCTSTYIPWLKTITLQQMNKKMHLWIWLMKKRKRRLTICFSLCMREWYSLRSNFWGIMNKAFRLMLMRLIGNRWGIRARGKLRVRCLCRISRNFNRYQMTHSQPHLEIWWMKRGKVSILKILSDKTIHH